METLTIQKNKLPEGWEIKKLWEIAEIIMGQSPPSKTYNTEKEGLPFFQGKAEFGEINPVPRKWCSEPNKIAKKNDILMSVRAPVGPVNLADSECCIGRGLCAIRANSEILNFKYIYNFLKLQEEVLAQKGQGSTFSAISRRDVQEILVPLPPLPVQKQIVSKLDDFFEHYNKLKQEKQKAKEKYEQILQSAIASLIPQEDLPIGWEEKTINDFYEVKGGKRLPQGKKLLNEKTKHPYIRVTDFSNFSVNLDSLKYIDNVTYEAISRYTLNADEIFISIAGSIGLVGIIPKEISGANLTENAAKLVLKERMNKKINNKYTMYYLFSTSCQHQIRKLTVSTGVPKFALFRIKKIKIPVPSLEEQNRILSKIEDIKKFNESINSYINNIDHQLSQLPKSVLSKAFKGELA